jgi:hypothetical protein
LKIKKSRASNDTDEWLTGIAEPLKTANSAKIPLGNGETNNLENHARKSSEWNDRAN